MKYLLLFCIVLFTSSSFAEDWKLDSNEENIKIFIGQESQKGIEAIKASTTFTIHRNEVLKVLLDIEKRLNWVPHLKSVEINKDLSPQNYVLRELYSMPWPIGDRLFQGEGKIIHKGKSTLIQAKSYRNPSKNKAQHIEFDVDFLNIVVTALSATKTQVDLELRADMGGWMSTWIINFIQEKWCREFLESLGQQLKSGQPRETKLYSDSLTNM